MADGTVDRAPRPGSSAGLNWRAGLNWWSGLNWRAGLNRWAGLRWWLRVCLIFLASRIVTTSILLGFASVQGQNAWTGPSPSYFDFARIWDGNWYYIIAIAGYPSELPITDSGQVGESAWAFMPAYPAVVRTLMFATGLDFGIIAVLVSVAFALAAALMFYKLMALVLDANSALFAVVLFCFAPLSPILQVAYAESMHAFLLTLALYLLVQRRYWLMIPVIAVMALTRPSGLAFALAMVFHVAHRWWRARRDAAAEPFPIGDRVASVTVAFVSGLFGLAWLLIAWAVTGSLTAYTDTELAWRAPYIGYGELIPFVPWFQGAAFWAPYFGVSVPVLVVILVLLVVGFFAVLFTPAVRRLGLDIRFWSASYALYLLAVFFPQSSTFRLLLPAFPLLGA
ncbi:MAG: hypothetical protein LH471_07095, partial [Salinibacterium sp.]|nr:hypothetical protein [Salinibacterium sp.]